MPASPRKRRSITSKQLAQNVVVWDPSARDALNTFLQAGQGDVLIGYENEAIFAQQAGQPLEYVVPDSTLLIENSIATTSVGDAPDAAAAFVEWLYSPEAQTIYGEHGFRPELEEVRGRVHGLRPADQSGDGRR